MYPDAESLHSHYFVDTSISLLRDCAVVWLIGSTGLKNLGLPGRLTRGVQPVYLRRQLAQVRRASVHLLDNLTFWPSQRLEFAGENIRL